MEKFENRCLRGSAGFRGVLAQSPPQNRGSPPCSCV